MSRFHFSLQALLKYREHQRDLCRQMLAQVLVEEDRLRAEQETIERESAGQLDEMRALNAEKTLSVERQAARRFHVVQLRISIQVLEKQRELVRQQADLCRQALLKADQGVKVLENLHDRQWEEFQMDEDRRSARELEELWQAGQLRKDAP